MSKHYGIWAESEGGKGWVTNAVGDRLEFPDKEAAEACAEHMGSSLDEPNYGITYSVKPIGGGHHA